MQAGQSRTPHATDCSPAAQKPPARVSISASTCGCSAEAPSPSATAHTGWQYLVLVIEVDEELTRHGCETQERQQRLKRQRRASRHPLHNEPAVSTQGTLPGKRETLWPMNSHEPQGTSCMLTSACSARPPRTPAHASEGPDGHVRCSLLPARESKLHRIHASATPLAPVHTASTPWQKTARINRKNPCNHRHKVPGGCGARAYDQVGHH
jgi:hypothetical protein